MAYVRTIDDFLFNLLIVILIIVDSLSTFLMLITNLSHCHKCRKFNMILYDIGIVIIWMFLPIASLIVNVRGASILAYPRLLTYREMSVSRQCNEK